jgi:DNA-directed RNA polymerase specialized sigma24 family protein
MAGGALSRVTRDVQDASTLARAVQDGDEAALSAVVDEHYGAMHRLARLVGRDEARAREAVRGAWLTALERPGEQRPGTSLRGWLLRLVLVELAATAPPEQAAPAAPEHELEPEGSRWAGWWKDDLPATPEPEREALEAAIASLPAALAAMLVLRDVEGLAAAEVEALFGHSPDRQIAFLQHGRTAVRNALRTSAGEAP